jgi:hypothetical protein
MVKIGQLKYHCKENGTVVLTYNNVLALRHHKKIFECNILTAPCGDQPFQLLQLQCTSENPYPFSMHIKRWIFLKYSLANRTNLHYLNMFKERA